MVTSLAPVFILAAQFPGGSSADLARSIETATGKPVVVLAIDYERYKPFEYDPANLNELVRAVRGATGLWQAPGEQHAFHPGTIPRKFIQVHPVGPGGFASGFLAAARGFEVKDGRLTWRAKSSEAVKLDSVGLIPLPKRMSCHWTHAEYWLSASVANMPEREFAEYVAKAAGARLIAGKDSYKLEFDPNEFRNRARRTFTEYGKPDELRKLHPTDRSSYDLALAGLNLMTAAQLTEAFETPQSSVRIPLATAHRGVVEARLRAFLESAQEMQRAAADDNPRLQPVPNVDTIRSVDLREPVFLIFQASFRAQLEVGTRGEFGRPGPRIRI